LRLGLALRAHVPLCDPTQTGSRVNVLAPDSRFTFHLAWFWAAYFATECSYYSFLGIWGDFGGTRGLKAMALTRGDRAIEQMNQLNPPPPVETP
jgi:hypothetical protein